MYISNIKIRNFRAIKNLDLNLNKGLNVLIGENNSGKTGIIDALRLVLEEIRKYVRTARKRLSAKNEGFRRKI